MKRKLFIRAESGTNIGLGHVMRCMALAEMLKEDFEISFFLKAENNNIKDVIEKYVANVVLLSGSNLPDEVVELKKHIGSNDILVLDGYNFKENCQKEIKQEIACKLVAIDDLHDFHQHADVVINHAVGGIEKKYAKESYTKLYCGLEYALVREEFRETGNSAVKKQKGTVLIAMGGADPLNYSGKLLEALKEVKEIGKINILIGKLNVHRKELEMIKQLVSVKGKQIELIEHLTPTDLIKHYLDSEVVILSASGMTIEALSVGIKPGVIQTAENQKDFYKYLVSNKMVTDCAGFLNGDPGETEKVYQNLKGANETQDFIGKNSKQIIRKIFSEL